MILKLCLQNDSVLMKLTSVSLFSFRMKKFKQGNWALLLRLPLSHHNYIVWKEITWYVAQHLTRRLLPQPWKPPPHHDPLQHPFSPSSPLVVTEKHILIHELVSPFFLNKCIYLFFWLTGINSKQILKITEMLPPLNLHWTSSLVDCCS